MDTMPAVNRISRTGNAEAARLVMEAPNDRDENDGAASGSVPEAVVSEAAKMDDFLYSTIYTILLPASRKNRINR